MDHAVPTKAVNYRKVAASRGGLTLDARFTIAAQLRQQANSRQSQGRDALLAKKRGLTIPAAASPAQKQVRRGMKPACMHAACHGTTAR